MNAPDLLVSIHDVMPETLPRVRALVRALVAAGHETPTLLVVPGRAWDRDGLRQLAVWEAAGLELAAHGWYHRVRQFGGLWHRLHGALFSRRAAEHLALSPDAILDRMGAAADWFPARGLATPTTYVPPAWALGRVEGAGLARLPYRRIEVTRGLLEVAGGRLWRLPLAGYEADTLPRRHFLRAWNAVQEGRAVRRGRPLRVAIHPRDAELALAGELHALLARGRATPRYDAFLPG
ncbi:MAG: polysaccharide deacetylase family protein [Thiohalospira sp.]